MVRRKELEKEQVALKEEVGLVSGGDRVSFLRRRVAGGDGDGDGDDEGGDGDGERGEEEVLGVEREEGEDGKGADVGVGDLAGVIGVGDGRVCGDDVNVLESLGARKEARRSKKARRDLRKGRSIQLHLHAIGREGYRRRVRSRGTEGSGVSTKEDVKFWRGEVG